MIKITELTPEMFPDAVKLIWQVFNDMEALGYPPEGQATFHDFIFDQTKLSGLRFWGALAADELAGVLAYDPQRWHISLFFVLQTYQHQGLGRLLFDRLRAETQGDITVNASPFAHDIYLSLGFMDRGPACTEHGITYIPMTYHRITPLTIRLVEPADAASLLDIYRHYVTSTVISYEYTVPSLDEFSARITNTLIRYPYLAACRENKIIGYAYASAFKSRKAYDWDIETSIYLRPDAQRQGAGRQLYAALEAILQKQNVMNMYACIACDSHDGKIMANASINFHTALGWQQVGYFPHSGYKFGQWHDMVYMSKPIGDIIDEPESFIPFSKLDR